MRVLFLLVWLMLPVLVGVYHLGPGQRQVVLDDTGKHVREAEQYVAAEDWEKAVASFNSALEQLPADRQEQSYRLRVERAKAQMMAHQLPEAHDDLKALVEQLQADDSAADEAILSEAREALANSQYYLTWLMRLEGVSREVWEPEIESARQTYRLLAENSQQEGESEELSRHQEDLESTIRLARMDLSELQGLPLPSQ